MNRQQINANPFWQPLQAGASADDQLVRATLVLAQKKGLSDEVMFRAATPSVEELEVQLGRDLVEQGRHMVAVGNAHHASAAAALNE